MINNALFDDVFLNELFHQREREIYAKITTLTYDEYPIESIEGRVSGGSISIDGDSILRRTCSINLVAPLEQNINEFQWGINNKFKLELGLSNNINNIYDNIIWFPQGIFVITNFDYNYTTKKCNISIKGKDKMCLLNGEVSGVIPHNTEFHVEQYYDLETDTITYTDVPIRTIISEIVKNFGDEQISNIIINDIEDAGLELLEYRGTVPMYLLRTIHSDVFDNITFNGEQECYYLDESARLKKTTIGDSQHIRYDNLVNLEGEQEPTKIILTMLKVGNITEEEFNLGVYYSMHKQFYVSHDNKYFISNSNKYFISDNTIFDYAKEYDPEETYYTVGDYYYIAKFESGSAPGYKLTDLTYAGDLIANAGDSVTSILDKIKSMLGDFEYFYNLDGKFVFQKKQKYNSLNWHSTESDEVIFNDSTVNMSKPIFSFLDGKLILSLKNNLKIENVKNDYSVWGVKKTNSGQEQKIHARYAIDIKPKFYKSYSGDYYITNLEYIKNIQADLHNQIIDKFTPMIEVGYIDELEFNNNIYYQADLQYYTNIEQQFYITSEDDKKYFVSIKNYFYNSVYNPDAIYYKPFVEKIHYVDWRELIYQMALDYRKHYHDSDFLYQIANNNKAFYPSGITGYERYYTDLEGFWRELYNPNPDPISNYVSPYEAIKYQENDSLYITNSFRKLNIKEQDQYIIDLTNLYILDYSRESSDSSITQIFNQMKEKELSLIKLEDFENEHEYWAAQESIQQRYMNIMKFQDIHETPEMIPFLGSRYCHLNYNDDKTKSNEIYFFQDENGQMNDGTDDINILNSVPLNHIYIKERGPFITLEGYDEITNAELRNYYYVKGIVEPDEIWPEIKDDQLFPEGEEFEPDTPTYDKYLNWLFDENGISIKDKNNKLFLIQKIGISDIEPIIQQKIFSARKNFQDNPSAYQYWVYKYPFGTNLGDYPDDYTNYAAQKFQEYLDEYGWDKLYIKDSKPIKFSNLEQPVQRLYYKQAQILTDFLYILQYDNFNELKTNYNQLEPILLNINPSTFKTFTLFEEELKNIMRNYLGEYPIEAKDKLQEIYKTKKLDNETEKTYLKKVAEKFQQYLDWLSDQYSKQINKPYYLIEPVQYQTVTYNFNTDAENKDYWSKDITTSPEILNYWFDFINGETSFLNKYSVQTIGPRPKVVNDNSVKAIYYKEVPNIIFITSQEEKNKYNLKTGYNYIQLPQEMQSIFVTSTRGKAATQAVEDLIYQHCYASESTSLSTIPIYHLQPNTCIYINDKITNTNNDYLITKITIPLEAKKQMSITATKVIPSII